MKLHHRKITFNLKMWIEETEREKEREQYEEDRLNEQTEIRNVDWRLNAFASFSL